MKMLHLIKKVGWPLNTKLAREKKREKERGDCRGELSKL
jgi:hypothetical protein